MIIVRYPGDKPTRKIKCIFINTIAILIVAPLIFSLIQLVYHMIDVPDREINKPYSAFTNTTLDLSAL